MKAQQTTAKSVAKDVHHFNKTPYDFVELLRFSISLVVLDRVRSGVCQANENAVERIVSKVLFVRIKNA